MVGQSQEQKVVTVFQEVDPQAIGSSTEKDVTQASGSRPCFRSRSRPQGGQTNKRNRSKHSFNHQVGSNSFHQVQKELNIKKEGHELIKASPQEGCEPKPEDNICVQILGARSGPIKGLDCGSKSNSETESSSSSVTSYYSKEKELIKKVKELRAKLDEALVENNKLMKLMAVWEDRWAQISKFMDGMKGEGTSKN